MAGYDGYRYYAWSHREWVIKKGATDLKREMALVSKFLSMDSRNCTFIYESYHLVTVFTEW
jgi:hypothetical protein